MTSLPRQSYSAKTLRTVSIRMGDDDIRYLHQLRECLAQTEPRSVVADELRAVHGRHAPYGELSDGQILRWALRSALERFPMDLIREPESLSYGGDRDRKTAASSESVGRSRVATGKRTTVDR
jgi:hypothetical protein